MRFLIVNTDYSGFLEWLYTQHPGLEQRTYEEQLAVRCNSLFGVADFYSRNLRQLGHEAHDVYVNNEFMQRAWAKGRGVQFVEPNEGCGRLPGIVQAVRRIAARTPLRRLKPLFRQLVKPDGWDDEFSHMLATQIRHYKPDVLLNQAMDSLSSRLLKEVKPYVRLLVGQHAATWLPEGQDFRCYDLVISSFQPTVDYFQTRGTPAVLHRLGFEPSLLTELMPDGQVHAVTFVGSLSRVHKSRVVWLESLCTQVPELRIWGPGVEQLPEESPLRARHMGQAWGREMYQILRNSKITLNHHGDVAPYANNCRLFEATGIGTMLITDWKANLQDLFTNGKEVVAYRTPEECADLIRYYLDHEDECVAIARAGQERTLRDHTYRQRMQELVQIVRKHIEA